MFIDVVGLVGMYASSVLYWQTAVCLSRNVLFYECHVVNGFFLHHEALQVQWSCGNWLVSRLNTIVEFILLGVFFFNVSYFVFIDVEFSYFLPCVLVLFFYLTIPGIAINTAAVQCKCQDLDGSRCGEGAIDPGGALKLRARPTDSIPTVSILRVIRINKTITIIHQKLFCFLSQQLSSLSPLNININLFSVAFTLFSRSFLAVQPATAALYDLLVLSLHTRDTQTYISFFAWRSGVQYFTLIGVPE
eukprot:gene7068-5006_t